MRKSFWYQFRFSDYQSFSPKAVTIKSKYWNETLMVTETLIVSETVFYICFHIKNKEKHRQLPDNQLPVWYFILTLYPNYWQRAVKNSVHYRERNFLCLCNENQTVLTLLNPQDLYIINSERNCISSKRSFVYHQADRLFMHT